VRLVPVLLVAGLLLAGGALAAEGDPVERHTKADMAKARSIVLAPADLGAGWKREPAGGDDSSLQCKNFRIDESDLVETGEADSPVFTRAPVIISSSASLYRTAAMSATSWRRAIRPGLAACLAEDAQKSVSEPGFTLRRRSAGKIPYQPLPGAKTAAYHLVFSASDGQTTVPVHFDAVFLQRGRAIAGVFLASFGARFPAAPLRELAALTAGRMR
jgi:hypothetical protein